MKRIGLAIATAVIIVGSIAGTSEAKPRVPPARNYCCAVFYNEIRPPSGWNGVYKRYNLPVACRCACGRRCRR